MGKAKMISVGKIIGFHGVKGEVKVLPLTDNPNRFNELGRIFICCDEGANDQNNSFVAHVERSFWHKNNIVVKFQEFNDRNEVEPFKSLYIKIPREERPKLPEGKYYHDDIVGLLVYDQEGTYLGEVKEIKETPSNDVYVISTREREFLIPAIKQVVKEISLDKGIMKIELMGGLIE